MKNDIAFPVAGGLAGAGVYSTIGGVGIVGGFGGLGIGLAGMAGVGTVIGSSVYGAFKGIEEQDHNALVALGLGGFAGARVYSTIGGVGLSFGGSAFGIGMGSMAVTGGILGLGIYGLAKMFSSSESKEPAVTTFNRMEEKIAYSEAYYQALMELDTTFEDLIREQQFRDLEIEDELNELKAKLNNNSQFDLCWNTYKQSFEFIPSNCESIYSGTEPVSLDIELKEKFIWQSVKTLRVHTKKINSFATQGNILASASDDRTVSLWNLNTGKQIYSFFEPQEVCDVAINRQHEIVAAGGFDRKIIDWKLDTKNLNHIFSMPGCSYSHDNVVYALTYSHKGKILISGSADKTIRIWDTTTGQLRATLNGHTDAILSLAISPCNRYLISGSADQTIRVWDLNNLYTKPQIIHGHLDWVTTVAITPDGKYLISGSKDKTVKIWCLKTQKIVSTITESLDAIWSVAISPDSKIIAVASLNNIVQLHDLVTGEHLQTLNACSPVVFSDDGKYLITSNNRNQIKFWQRSVETHDSIDKSFLNKPWWQVLGVAENSKHTEIKTAYRNLSRQYHPDLNPADNARKIMYAINQAYQQYQTSLRL